VRLRSIAVILDAEPPAITAIRLTRPDGPQGPIIIEATATDNAGLRAAARYRIAVNGTEEAGVLRCDGQTGRCATTLPPRDGTVTLQSVTIEDYAGNRTETKNN
jgi:hypothetical protein